MRRVLQTVPIMLAVALLIFVLFSVIPGTFISGMGEDGRTCMDAEVMERMSKEIGLDDPLHVRFAKYVCQLAQLDLGISFRTPRAGDKLLAAADLADAAAVFAAMVFAIVHRRAAGFPRGAEARQPGRHRCRWSAPSRACRCRSSGSA